MRKLLWTLAAAGAVASGVGVAACGDDDSSPASPGTPDGGPITHPDSGPPGPGTDGGGDGGPGACTFQSFVVELVDNHTTATATPSTDLGDSCPDDHTGTAFAKYFP